jgi:hypothetical protein
VVCNKNPDTNAAITCPSSSPAEQAVCDACEAANRFMDLKAQLLQESMGASGTYRCDVFQNSDGSDCDVFGMTAASGQYTNDCLIEDNSVSPPIYEMRPKVKTCDLAEFSSYVANWHQRLTRVYSRVDSAVPAALTSIQVQLRDLVFDAVVRPIDYVIDHVTGGFLKRTYGGLIDGLCFKAVVGVHGLAVACVWNAVLAIILIITGYGLWRHGVDNRNAWRDAHTKMAAYERSDGEAAHNRVEV